MCCTLFNHLRHVAGGFLFHLIDRFQNSFQTLLAFHALVTLPAGRIVSVCGVDRVRKVEVSRRFVRVHSERSELSRLWTRQVELSPTCTTILKFNQSTYKIIIFYSLKQSLN